MSDTIRLFLGSSPNGEDYEADAVAEYSARKNSSLPIDLTWMRQSKSGPYSGWSCGSGRTPFSHYRWSLPAMCGFAGRAIYADADFVFMADLAELWRQPIPGVILCLKSSKPSGKIRTCCMVFDCAKAKGIVPDLKALKRMPDPQGTLSKQFYNDAVSSGYECGNWNVRDPQTQEELLSPDTKAVHHTHMYSQLHLSYVAARLSKEGREHWYRGEIVQHKNEALRVLFDELLKEAQAAGYTYESYGYGKDGFVPVARKGYVNAVPASMKATA